MHATRLLTKKMRTIAPESNYESIKFMSSLSHFSYVDLYSLLS